MSSKRDLLAALRDLTSTSNYREYNARTAYWAAKEKHLEDLINTINEQAEAGLYEVEMEGLKEEHVQFLTDRGFSMEQRGQNFRVSWAKPGQLKKTL